ncbi:glycosyltransferase family 8 protein [Streptomyces sp. NPDC094034]|uniref:glycosyltransferase family 8 protein n=1 Tax=Streptomyces sp. NPDC094034 TaxID=3155309 RepID=UPI00331D5E4C
MTDQDLHVAFCIDDGYASGAVVTARSIQVGLRPERCDVTFHVLDGGLSVSGREHVRRALAAFGTVTLHSVPDLLALSYQRKWITTPAVGRLYLEQVLPKDVGRVVYLDADTLVLEDLAALSDFDLEGRGVGAVSNEAGPDRSVVLTDVAVQREHGAKPPGYFNSGVLLVDLDLWRAEQVTEQAMRLFHQYRSSLRSVDQDILNIIFEGSWTKLPGRWNKQIDNPRLGRFGEGRLDYLVQREGIVHYTGETKPWHTGFPSSPLLELYEEYAQSATD